MIMEDNRYRLTVVLGPTASGKTPKQLIDEQLTAEIKVRLDNPVFTVSEIADYSSDRYRRCRCPV